MAMAARPGEPVVARVWHGKTPREKADEYEKYLAGAITKFPSIKGNLGYQMMRIDGGPDGKEYTEFQVVSYWESRDAIHAYAGAGHSFFSVDRPAYRPEAAVDGWRRIDEFFATHLKG